MTQSHQEPALACNLAAIPTEQRAAHEGAAKRLFARIQEVQELPNGYAFRLPGESDVLSDLIAYISNERLCCSFFHFGLDIEPEQGPIWLRLTASVDVKPFMRSQGFSPELEK